MMPKIETQNGFVLIVTLWVLVILGVMLTNLSYQTRVEANVERWALDQSQLRWAARGAIHTAASRIRNHIKDEYHDLSAEWWSDETLYKDQKFGPVNVSLIRPSDGDEPAYGLDDNESRLNINVAHPQHLMGFPGVSSVVAEAIVLFRLKREEAIKENDHHDKRKAADESKKEPDKGDKADEIVSHPIRSLRELLEVEEVTEDLLFGQHEERPPLAELLTTLSSGKVNVNTASYAVLRAVGFSEDAVTEILEQRQENPFRSIDDLLQTFAKGQPPKKRARMKNILAVRSSTFRLNAQATLPKNKRTFLVEAVLVRSGESMNFIRWREH